MKAYLKYTLKPSYNFIFGGLLLVLYEGSMLLVMPTDGPGQVRNAVDSLFTQILDLIPNGTLLVSSLLFLIGIAFLVSDLRKGVELKGSYLLLMGVESVIWALLIFFNLGWIVSRLFSVSQAHSVQLAESIQLSLSQEVALSLGAGFYEEFFFRLILVYVLLFIAYLIGMNHKDIGTRILVLLVSAVLFSLAHFDFIIGELGDPFGLHPFIFRALFGLLMSFLLVYRGFGITAWTHALYDVFIFVGRALSG